MVHEHRLFSVLLTHFSLCQHHVKVQALLNSQQVKGAYLEPNSDSLQKPVEGLSFWRFSQPKTSHAKVQPKFHALYKGGIVCREH